MPVTESGTSFHTYGSAENPPIIFIHGLGLTHQTWDAFVPAFAERYYVITYDLCGHGQSRLPEGTVTLSTLSQQIRDLMDSLSLKAAHLVGFSLGGMINRRFAMDYPDEVLSLAILNSPHERDPALQKQVEAQAIASAEGGIEAVLDAALIRWFTASFREQHPETVDIIRQTLLRNDTTNYAKHRFVLANGVLELIDPTPALTHPTLVITCENDTGSTPAMSEAISQEIAGSQLLILPQLQHLGLLEEPEHFITPLLSFLSKAP